jgi:hypothetical protein
MSIDPLNWLLAVFKEVPTRMGRELRGTRRVYLKDPSAFLPVNKDDRRQREGRS